MTFLKWKTKESLSYWRRINRCGVGNSGLIRYTQGLRSALAPYLS
jgi:hypothetical protein